MAGISSPGVGSGLDIGSIVSQLVAAERAPAQSIINRESAELSAELSAFGTLKSKLGTIEDALTSLAELKTERSTSVSDSDRLGVSATPEAFTGNYRIQIEQLARAQTLASAGYADTETAVGNGTITLSVGDADPVEVAIDAENNTLQGIADAINAADAGVGASIINDGSGFRLVLNAQDTGADNTVSVTVADDDGNSTDTSGLSALAAANLSETVAAQDARFTVNGLSIISASNVNDSAIQGLTLTLKQFDPATTVTIAVTPDENAVKAALQAFVEGYNGLINQVKQFTAYDPETRRGGVLVGDSLLRGIVADLQNGLFDPVEGAPAEFDNLVELGITTDRDGKMQLDEELLDAAMAEDFGGVVSMLNQAATGFKSLVSGMLETGGVIESRTEGIETRLEDVDEEQIDLNRRMAGLEERLLAKFTAMDQLVAQLQTTSNYLTQQLANLPTPGE